MVIDVDLSALPPVVTLLEPDDFRGFKVVVRAAEHAAVPVAVLEDLAGPDRAADPAWRAGLEAMLAYAAEHGWVLADGAIRAHVERG